ncbi:DUF6286 domain-containing protein [Streptomyces sp. ODS28]|uniref:DUF6286 domain-containing protein n=1 Tax=Streptomyces sp. ODS28 TaxID=3136688 RepID=UPI0031E6BDC7
MSEEERTEGTAGGAGSAESTQRLPTLEKGPAQEKGPSLEKEPAPGPEREPEAGGRAHRFWSARRVPAALVALVLLAAVGVLLYDVASVRGGRTAMPWRRTLAEDLATTRLDSTVVIAGAAVAAVLGLWLIVLALTPGLRGVLPMRREGPEVRAGLERSAAALVLRDRAMAVSGVQSVRVGVGRRKVKARVQSHFRDLDEVRSDLDAVLADGVRELGLARRMRVKARVRRPAAKG